MTAHQLTPFAEYRKQPDFGCSIPEDRDAWLIAPCGQNRDSDSLTRSNFAVQLAELERLEAAAQSANEDAEYIDLYELHSFNHWACGWVEIVIVRPGTAAAEYAAELAESLEDYPVADEEHFSQLETDEAAESWERYGASDFKRDIQREYSAFPRVCDLLDNATDEQLRELHESGIHSGEFYVFDSGGCNFMASNVTRERLAELVRVLRSA